MFDIILSSHQMVNILAKRNPGLFPQSSTFHLYNQYFLMVSSISTVPHLAIGYMLCKSGWRRLNLYFFMRTIAIGSFSTKGVETLNSLKMCRITLYKLFPKKILIFWIFSLVAIFGKKKDPLLLPGKGL